MELVPEEFKTKQNFCPRDIKILGWYPWASLTSWEEGALVGHPSSDGVTIKMPYGVCFTSTSFAPYPFLLGWLKLNLAILLDQLRLA